MKEALPVSNPKIKETFIWVLKFITPYKWTFLLIVLSGIFISVVELMVPKFIQYFIDEIVYSGRSEVFWWLFSLLASFIFAMVVVLAFQNYLQRNFQEKVCRDIQVGALSKIHDLGMSYLDRIPIGQTLSLLNTEIYTAQKIYNTHIPNLLRDGIFSIVSLIIMISMDYRLTLTIVPCLALYYLIGPYFEKKAEKKSADMTESNVQYNQMVYESISSIPELKASGTEKWNYDNVMTKLITHNKDMVDAYLYAFARGSIRRITYYIGAVVFFVYGSFLVIEGQLSVGMFVAFLFYYFTTMHKLTSVITNVTELKIKMYQVERIYTLFHQEPLIVEAKNPIMLTEQNFKIEFKSVSFSYNSKRNVLKDINLDINKGEKIALVGHSGSGKSTLIKLLGRFYDPTQGNIYMQGLPLKEISLDSLREHIGFVFQETYLFGISILENIKVGNPRASETEVINAAKQAYAHDFIMSLPQGYDTILGDRGEGLSGGQKQRIAIAKLLLKNPSIIVLDEATSALDNSSSEHVTKAFERLFKGRSVVAIAHRISTIADYDRILVFEKGEIVQSGSYDELIHTNGLFNQIVNGSDYKSSEIGVH
ncbi:ABC transporter ATP-binding protein [Jeotgalibacillus sp. ET6]|uniref:ABC transporter ATP-binding protein n=1 Tax=Jeotgalibacillus sp. ET6 TaxID=3037260 RepID=UPI0024185D39|nr:ABC transporter ATP-binding protein [Jeotgalibacillus sp. ET6]MDG5473713.1 ABC transporter ATP-binding protein [Jeotgalibacillus sp. ET6]